MTKFSIVLAGSQSEADWVFKGLFQLEFFCDFVYALQHETGSARNSDGSEACPEVLVSCDGWITASSALVPSKTLLHHAAGPDWFNAVKIQMPAVCLQLMVE